MIELTKTQTTYGTNLDDVIIQKFIADIPGGREIDFTGYENKVNPSTIPAGHVIIAKDGNYRPHPVSVAESEDKTTVTYGTITEGYTIVGVLYRTVTKDEPSGSVLIDGVVNEAAVSTPYTADIKKALAAIGIKFVKDENPVKTA